MPKKKKGLRHVRLSNDQNIYKFVYDSYEPSDCIQIILSITIGLLFLKNTQIGEIKFKKSYNASQEQKKVKRQQKIVLPLTGTIFQLGNQLQLIMTDQFTEPTYKLSPQTKSGNILLFLLRLCDHQPQKMINLKNNTPQMQLNPQYKNLQLDICSLCKEILWFYYDSKITKIKFSQLKKIIDTLTINNISQLHWKVILNQHFTKNTTIGQLNGEQFSLNLAGKIVSLYNFKDNNTNICNDTIILEIKKVVCRHERIKDNLCQFCLQNIDEVDNVPPQLTRNYFFQLDNHIITNGRILKIQQDTYVNNLLNQFKAILILDLDNTILHSIETQFIQKKILQNMQDYYLILMQNTINNIIVFNEHVTKIRQFFKQFLIEILDLYEIIIYTKGTKLYAYQICAAILQQYGNENNKSLNLNKKLKKYNIIGNNKCFIPQRIITRSQDPDLQLKSITNVLPSRKDCFMILDDRRQVWGNQNSCIFTKKYIYFIKELQKYMIMQNNLTKQENNILMNQFLYKDKINKQKISNHVYKIEQQQIYVTNVINRNISKQKNIIMECNNNKEINELLDNENKQIQQKQQIINSLNQENQIKNNNNNQCQMNILLNKNQLFVQDKQKKDYFLLFAAHCLRMIHKIYFNRITNKQYKNQLSFSQIHKQYKISMINNYKVKLFYNKQQTSNLYRRCKKMKLKIIQSLKQQQEKPNLIIRQTILESQRIKQLEQYMRNSGIFVVVSEIWIHFCYEYTYAFDYKEFILENPLQIRINEDKFQQNVQSIAMNIKQDIANRHHLN